MENVALNRDFRREFVKRLLNWHKSNQRSFPWRKTRDPYVILVAELMLQKTPAERVAEVLDKFTSKYPDVRSLASASMKDLEQFFTKLGLVKRARALLHTAKEVVLKYEGVIPDTLDELCKLPGVGTYTASAILCFAFGKDVPIVDTNVARVLMRVFGLKIKAQKPQVSRQLWSFAATLVPRGLGRAYNEALIDFAALVCRTEPKCNACPLSEICHYFSSQT